VICSSLCDTLHDAFQSPIDLPTVQYAKMTPAKIGSSFVGVPAIPLRHPVREITLTAKQKCVSAFATTLLIVSVLVNVYVYVGV
jgi:hypothetical protein